MANCRIELSKQIGDYLAGTVTTDGGSASLIDTQLIQYSEDWITDWTWDFITGTTNSGEERRISSLDNSSGDCTLVTAHGTAVTSGATYEIHRLFPATKKRQALIAAARMAFPSIHEKIWDESMVSGNWLKDGSFEIWNTAGNALTHWTTSGSTLTKNSTAYQFEHGAYSCQLGTAIGYIQQTVTNWDDLKRLAGRTVTFTIRGWCDTASCLKISINDGTTETSSSFHDGDDVWTRDNNPITVTQTIADGPSEITFKIYHAVAAATSRVDDARVICSGTNPRLFI